MCLGSACLSRPMCDLVDSLGMTLYMWPKKNSVSNASGSYAWASMMGKFEEQSDEFKFHYHARSTVEGVFSALKTRYGNALKCTDRIAQRREISLRVVCYNINVVNGLRIAADIQLTHE